MTVEWAHLMRLPPQERIEVLQESAYCDQDPHDTAGGATRRGWIWPAEPDRRWLGRYEFDDALGSYTPHFRAANTWDAVREAVSPAARSALDDFLSGLIWWGPDPEVDARHIDEGVFPSFDALWRSGPVIARKPDTVADLLGIWQQAQPLLIQLREPFQNHLPPAESGDGAAGFEGFARLLAQWADVLGEAHRRGWGVIGLPI
ncbi:hypothetical protein [Streptomyces lasiicapitis]|uniref:hypothetical protein n=1 Tax=Streptomyces lasiicapitis TaxID=1923961 RepID=UPI0036BC99A4